MKQTFFFQNEIVIIAKLSLKVLMSGKPRGLGSQKAFAILNVVTFKILSFGLLSGVSLCSLSYMQ